jgi:hypothetical protein
MSGHGWVTPNADGSVARCGGPGLCPQCSVEAGRPPRKKQKPLPRHRLHLALRCSCGGTLNGTISAPLKDVFSLRDIFLSFHREAGCTVTDTSEEPSS